MLTTTALDRKNAKYWELADALNRMSDVDLRNLDTQEERDAHIRARERTRAELAEVCKTGLGPEVGMLCTACINGDSYAGKVTYVSANKGHVLVTTASGNDRKFTQRADGSYREVGGRHTFLRFFYARDHWDPSF